MRINNRKVLKKDPLERDRQQTDLLYKNMRKARLKQDKWQEVWGLSTHYEDRNQTKKWYNSDSKYNFEVNKRVASSRELLERNGWLDKNIDLTYRFNEHGFRSESFKKKCKVLFNGCSQTMGIGLPLHMMWSSKVAEHLDVPHHSIACSGADWQHVCQRTLYWIPKLKPEIMIIQEPPLPRFNWWDKETVVSTAQFTSDELLDCKINESRPLVDIVDDNNSLWYRHSMKMLIEKICDDNDVQLIIMSNEKSHERNSNDEARDLKHRGPREHHTIFTKIIKIIDKNI